MDFGLLLIHVFIGVALAIHGTHKLFGWFGGYGLEGTGGYLESFGFRPGKLFAGAAGTAELVGGALLALGLLTPVAAVLVAATMLVAARTDHRGRGPWIFNGGWEYVLTITAVVIGLAFNGAGAWSLDAAIGWDVSGIWWGIGTAVLSVLGAGTALTLGRRVSLPAPSTLVSES